MTLDNQRVHLLAVPGNFEFALVFSVGYSEERNRFEQLATLRCNQSSVSCRVCFWTKECGLNRTCRNCVDADQLRERERANRDV